MVGGTLPENSMRVSKEGMQISLKHPILMPVSTFKILIKKHWVQ